MHGNSRTKKGDIRTQGTKQWYVNGKGAHKEQGTRHANHETQETQEHAGHHVLGAQST